MSYTLREAKNLPGTPGLPLLGNIKALATSPQLYFWQCYQKYGPVFKVNLIGMKVAVLVGPEANQLVLKDQAEKFSSKRGYWFLRRNLGEGILLRDGAEHRITRKLIQPAFHSQAIEGYFKTVVETVEQFYDDWEEHTPVRCTREFHRLTFRIACRLLLSNQDREQIEELHWLFSRYVKGSASLSTLLGLNIPQTTYGRARKAYHQLKDYFQAKIDQRRSGKHSSLDMLGLLMDATDDFGQPLDDSEIITLMLQLIFAARDTSAQLLCWLTYELAQHPVWTERLRSECIEVVGSGPLQMSHLKHLQCMEWVLKEVERIYAPVYVIPRGVVSDVEFADYRIPAGWYVNISPFITHRLESIYANPDTFDPERFAPPREEHKRHNFALIGFGGGARKCLGYELAQMEMKVVLAAMLRRFRWEVTPTKFEVDPCFEPFNALRQLYIEVQRI